MPNTFINHLSAGVVRKNPLGPATLNLMHSNIEVVNGLVLSEHLSTGRHNAPEVPWVLGAVSSATTGFLFDTTYGGTTIARPAVGRATVSVASGVVGEVFGGTGANVPAAAVIANVSDAAIANVPHTIEAQMISTTSLEVRTRLLTSTLGSIGNLWSSTAVGFDVALHAQKQAASVSLLSPSLLKRRRDFLTDQATDWSALVGNQGIVRKTLSLEHGADGAHNVNRIAKAWGWFRPSAGPSFSIVIAKGVGSVARVALGIVDVTVDASFTSATLAACFPQGQPTSPDELIIVNGRCTGVKTFRFYIYAYSLAENKWTRADRPFSAPMFGAV